MNRKHQHWMAIAIALVVITAALFYLSRSKPIEVLVANVEIGDVENTVANTRAGTVKACRRAKLSPAAGGQIANLPVKEGDRVTQGQLLLELWNKDLTAQLALAKSEAKSARAQSKAACLQAKDSQREANRLQRLYKKGAVSEELKDSAVTKAKVNQAGCEAAQSTAQVSLSRIGVVEANLERTRLTAPFDGVIAEINGELNEYVTPSPPGIPTPPVIDVIDNSCFYVSAPIDEVDAGKIKVDMQARVSLDAFDKQYFAGQVRRIDAYVLDKEKQARTVGIEVELIHKEDIQQLLAGYSADAEIVLDIHKDTLRIPSEAIIEDNRVFVYLAEDQQLETRQVKTGISNWDYTEVTEGLKKDEQVVISVDRDGVEDGAYARAEREQP